MGKLLSLLAREDTYKFTSQKSDVFLDFENAKATPSEQDTFDEVQQVLLNYDSILDEIQCYKGAGKEIREAISNPTETCQSEAIQAVLPLIMKLKRFYDFSTELEIIVPKILEQLCSRPMTPTQHLETQQALVKQFAEIIEFVLKFDEYKMKTPAIQNDLSFYRRTVSRQRMTFREDSDQESPEDDSNMPIGNDLANRMSLFYAHATPMLKALSEATSSFVEKNIDIPIDNMTETLSTMAKVCLRMLENPTLIAQFQREETQLFVLRVMVGLVILYDHVHPNGAFVKASNVDVKGCVKLLKDQPSMRAEGLLNALRYTTKHLNEDATPKNIKSLLAV